ncbi:polysaccharide lyase 8 family protein [Helcococcus kunzii]|uniref:polysaccharide lyase 8 family protein n=1 Tax=Helcococcus kunzii TaxID=40091 RepID=UPI0021A929CF|nr:polysaccharide lyase 8 family protein [Helcococcus kunzii]MCT1796507.1 polysaccharide lyase 8 family protein [Helcococcus kunzii]MCT1988319.1 polysaccharide lyase 8 family protein [Helcococcus kunzii]
MNTKKIKNKFIILIYIFSFVIISNVVYAQEEIEKKNLIKNGDFTETNENKKFWTGKAPKDWNLWISKEYLENDELKEEIKNQYKYEILENIDNKKNVLYIDSQSEFRTVVNQDLKVESDKEYELSFDIKTKNKKGNIYIRIIEKKGNEQKNLWYSEKFTGNNEWKTSKKIYKPLSDIDNIRVEIFYDKGLGSIYIDDISLTEKEKNNESIREDELSTIEETITLELNKKYLLNKPNLEYKIKDDILKIENGFIVPTSVGKTIISTTDNGQDKIISVEIKNINNKYLEMIEEWNKVIAGNEIYDSTNEIMRENHENLELKAQEIINTFNFKMDGYLWEETKDYEKSSSLTTTYRKLELLAKQITNKESSVYNDKKAIEIVKNSLNWMYKNVYHENKDIVGNWWDYEIGTPRAINNTLSLMYRYFSEEDIHKYLKPIYKFVPDPYIFRATLSPFKATGGNLVDMGRVKIIAGILNKDDETISETIKSMQQLFEFVNNGEGFYMDGSYIAHTNLASTGSYGNVLIDGLTQLLPIIQKTNSPLGQDKLQTLLKWYDNSFIPLIFKGELMDMSRGRGISRENLQSHAAAVEILRSIARSSDLFDVQTNDRLKGTIKQIVKLDSYYDVYDNLTSYKDIELFNNILNDNSIKLISNESYIKNLANMDKAVIYNSDRDYAIALSMHSSRTQNYEEMNEENKRGWYTGDGMIYLYNGDLSHYSDGFWPTVDATKLPGVTALVEQRQSGENSGSKQTMGSSLVGGLVHDSKHAIFGMDFSNYNKTLFQKKSWFIVDNKIVLLGAPIINKTDKKSYTTLENRKINSKDYELIVDGKKAKEYNFEKKNIKNIFLKNKMENKNIGYKLLENNNISFKKETRSDSWNSINSSQSNELVTNEFISIVNNNDKRVKSYAYIMYPNISEREFNNKNQEIKVLSNDIENQVIEDTNSKTIMAVKYLPKEYNLYDGVKISKEGLYYLTREDSIYKIKANTFEGKNILKSVEIDLSKYELLSNAEDGSELRFRLRKKDDKHINDENSNKKEDRLDKSNTNKTKQNNNNNKDGKNKTNNINKKAKDNKKITQINVKDNSKDIKKKKEVKNPSTGDKGIKNIFIILIISIILNQVIFVKKKTKERNQ